MTVCGMLTICILCHWKSRRLVKRTVAMNAITGHCILPMLNCSPAIPSDDSCGMKQSQKEPPEHAAIAYAALLSADHLQY